MDPPIHLTPTGRRRFDADPADAVAVLASGGVDSTAALLLLRDAGVPVVGVTMTLPAWALPAGVDPVARAAAACEALGVAHYAAETAAAFEACVVQPFRDAYRAGRTPNPCCDCNPRLKLGRVWDAVAAALGIRSVATGHYAQVLSGADGRARLVRGVDPRRDQSYFLYRIDPERLPRFRLPLGALGKDEVRRRVAAHGLAPAAAPDSMDLCFAGPDGYRAALGGPAETPGPIRTTDGRALGRHRGLWNYTVGQRRGLGICGPEPLYVLRLDTTANVLVVGPAAEASRRRVAATDPHALQPESLVPGARLRGRIRSLSALAACTVVDATPARVTVEFDAPQFGPAPGQHLVLYDAEDGVVGGGVIACDPLGDAPPACAPPA